MERVDAALLFPPAWYFCAVPADLSLTAGTLAARGLTTWAWDGSAQLLHAAVGASEAFRSYQDPAMYADKARHAACEDALYQQTHALAQRHGCSWGPRHLRFPDIDEAEVPAAVGRGLDPIRNPALPLLERAAQAALRRDPTVIAIALVHPDQRAQALALASLLRPHHRRIVLYGCLEDVLAPSDFAPCLLDDHVLFDLVDGVIVGDADDALTALSDPDIALEAVPHLLRRGMSALPERQLQSLDASADFAHVVPEHHLAPTPVVDLRLGRGCPWGRCRFCGIQAHHPGYRTAPMARLLGDMARAHAQLGSTVFRIRDDLLTPRQLRELGQATASLPFRPRWSARARFTSGLTEDTLRIAVAGGLEELWLGLESAVPRVRALMDKGVEQPVVERVLAATAQAGVRVRLLCLVGFPGETEAEARATLEFIEAHPTAGFSVTPFREVRASPLSTRPVPPTRTRLDAIRDTPTPAWMDAVMQTALQLGVRRASPGPDPVHRWLSDRPSM